MEGFVLYDHEISHHYSLTLGQGREQQSLFQGTKGSLGFPILKIWNQTVFLQNISVLELITQHMA